MPIEIIAPTFGESIVEATVGQWRKHEGDNVAAGEPLVELETDKINIEVVAPEDGVLAAILKGEGETIGVGDTLARLEPGGVAAATPAASARRPARRPPRRRTALEPPRSRGASPLPAMWTSRR